MGEQEPSAVLVDRDGAVATLTLGRPALDLAVKVALRDALAEVADDDAVRAVVLTGTGGAFCVGQDLAEHARVLQERPELALHTVDEHYRPIVRSLVTMRKPVVGAVNGTCVGAGLGFALACDVRVMAAGARLATAFTGIGLTSDSGLALTLVEAVGAARARELLLLGTTFTAEEAVAMGIAGRIVAAEDVAAAAAEVAARLAAGPTRAFAETKTLVDLATAADLETVMAAESAAQQRLGVTEDHQGAVRSFLAKQRPTFTGR